MCDYENETPLGIEMECDSEPFDIDGDTEGALASAGWGLEESYCPGGVGDWDA